MGTHRTLTMGKVHGSLARAGKVRGQVQKVEPAEKKKPKTGRAKKRIVQQAFRQRCRGHGQEARTRLPGHAGREEGCWRHVKSCVEARTDQLPSPTLTCGRQR